MRDISTVRKQVVEMCFPCKCNADIAETADVTLVDMDMDDHINIVTNMFHYHEERGTFRKVYEYPETIVDSDNLNAICTACGASYAAFNPLFDYNGDM